MLFKKLSRVWILRDVSSSTLARALCDVKYVWERGKMWRMTKESSSERCTVACAVFTFLTFGWELYCLSIIREDYNSKLKKGKTKNLSLQTMRNDKWDFFYGKKCEWWNWVVERAHLSICWKEVCDDKANAYCARRW